MDVRTMAVMGALVGLLLAVLLFAQYRFNRGYPGLGWWAAGQILVAAGFVVTMLRGDTVIGHLAVPAYQALLVGGSAFIFVGVRAFLGRPMRARWLVALWVALVVWATYFTFVVDSAKLRSIALYLALAIVLGATGLSLWRHRPPAVRGSATFLAVVFLTAAAGYLVLTAFESVRTQPDDVFFAPSPVNAGAFVTAVASMLLWTFGLIIMMNQRLSATIVRDARNMHSVFSTGPDCAIISRLRDGRIDDVNAGFATLTGYANADVIGRTSIDLGLWVDARLREEYVRRVAADGSVADFPMLMRRQDGTTIECTLSATTLTLEDEPYLITVARDVTQQRRFEAELQHEAMTDGLTGLSNRRHFLDVCERELRRSARSGAPLAVAVLDIDRFKDINDTHGHAAGDAAIVAFAQALMSGIRDIDTCGRLGGDEFALLLPEADVDRAIAAVERLRLEVAAHGQPRDYAPVTVTFSAGVASTHGDRDTVDSLLARADEALYRSKAQGRDRVSGAPA